MEKNSLVAAPGRQPGRRDRDGQAVQAQVWEEEQGQQSNNQMKGARSTIKTIKCHQTKVNNLL